ncbi:MAG TPA: hypothetical protein VMW72_15740 [Sedimentisphaerales bacterium]|nr:hypothetical protein [Sedimentisphaerales bacterium]
MKKYFIILLGCVVCSFSFAEYKEFELLSQSSSQVLKEYAERLASIESKFEGAIKFGQALQAINHETAGGSH